MAADAGILAEERGRFGEVELAPSPRRRWFREVGWRHLVALLGCAFALFPVVWVVSASLNPIGSLSGAQLIPSRITLDNYRDLLTGTSIPYLTWLWNSLLVAGGAALVNTFLSAFAAYAFSRMRFRGRRAGLLTVLLVQMFPQLLAVVAIFLFMTEIKQFFPLIGHGTLLGLFLVYLAGAMGINTWLMKGFYDTIPKELDESAKVDGASHTQTFFRIILPLVTPVLAVVGLLSFIFLFNEFIIATALLRGTEQANLTLPLGLQGFINDRYGSRWGEFSAGAILGGAPIIVIFLYLQRYIVSGLTAGSVKG